MSQPDTGSGFVPVELFEKYAKRGQQRDIVAIVMGTLGTVGVVLAALRLRELRDDRRAVALLAVRSAARRPGRSDGSL